MDGSVAVGASRSRTRWFEDFEIGERFSLPARTMSSDVFRHYMLASGDVHPLEGASDGRDCEPAAMMAHGFQVLIQTTAGASDLHAAIAESLIGLLDQSSRFARPVHAGDVLRPMLQVVELAPNTSTGVVSLRSTVHNQRRELVLDGAQRYLLRRRPRH